MREVRTRFAPSPTGYMHIGNLRTALYEYLIARKNKGKFILRIEDTDQSRLMEDSLDVIYNTLKLVGINYDEGPDKAGVYGPYVQSQRISFYLSYGKKLIDNGHAYYCFCTKERLGKLRLNQELNGIFPHYDGCCETLSAEEIKAKIKAGVSYVIRQRMPKSGKTTFFDSVFGDITVSNRELEDQILIKSDGYPTYNFANVIDDHLMGITHVIRGSEYLSSTPKYNLLYDALSWEKPTYIHLPLILDEDGHKLSKRNDDISFESLVEEGYLVEAIINFVALLGWSSGDGREFFTLKELENNFTVEGINKSPSIFNKTKLKWMNGEYIRRMTIENFHIIALPYIKKGLVVNLNTIKIAKILQKRIDILTEIPSQIVFFNSLKNYNIDLYEHKKMKTNKNIALNSLKKSLKFLENLDYFSQDIIHDGFIELAKEMGVKNGQLLWPLRVAVTGQNMTPGGAIEIIDILGKEESIKRIKRGIKLLEKEMEVIE